MQVLDGRLQRQARPAGELAEHAQLVHRIAADRDESAFRSLFAVFGPRVKAMLMRQGSDAQLAEDVAQEALLSVWRKAALYAADKGSVATWVFTIARNLRIDRLRRETVFQTLDDDRPEEACDAPLPDEWLASGQIQGRVRRVLAGLPQEQVEVVTLAYIDGLSHSEIAGKLGLPMGTVKSRMRLAYQKLRTAFEDLQ
jgi:RNA polymerase sigma-70 factor (ECF subfamily)